MTSKPALALFFLGACAATEATTAQRVVGPDGSPDWWSLTCRDSIGDCVAQARVRCPRGYEEEQSTDSSRDTMGRGEIPRAHTKKAKALSGEMFIRCKEPAEKAPPTSGGPTLPAPDTPD